MELWKAVSKNKLFWVGLIIPLVFQIIYLCVALPALKDGNSNMKNLEITIVNEDAGVGPSVAAKLREVLPFTTDLSSDLKGALNDMDEGSTNMVIFISGDFSTNLTNGKAGIQYYINQSTSTMTRQAMERTAISINQILNEMAFGETREAVATGSATALSQAGLPDGAAKMIANKLSQTFDSWQYNSIQGDIQKVNNADGFIQTVFPFFIFLTYFVGCTIMSVLHTIVYKPLFGRYSRSRILCLKLAANIVAALVIPGVVLIFAAAFSIPIEMGLAQAWILLSMGFFTLTYMVQMFGEWLGIPGIGLAAVVLFPLQLVTCGIMYSPAILPSFYSGISRYLPASHWGDGLIKLFYGGGPIAGDVRPLVLMSAVFLIIVFLTLFKRTKHATAKNGESN